MSKPATIAQSGGIVLPTITQRAAVSPRHSSHRFSVGDTLCVMSWGRNTYDKMTVTAVDGDTVTMTEEAGAVVTMTGVQAMFLAGQAYAHHYAGPETPGVGIIAPSEGCAHNITVSGRCLTCS